MKQKPGWSVLILLTIVLTIGIPSCGGEDYAAIRDIRQIIIFDPIKHQPLVSPASTSSDSLELIISNEIDFFSYDPFVPGTMSEAWAFRPANPWMANEITDIRVFCNQPIYGQPAHHNLADQLKFGNSIEYQLSLEMFLETLPDIGDNYDDFSMSEFRIFLNTKPEKGTYIFTIEIEDNNGHVFLANTIPVEWI